ncbi:MAG: NTP transferase domain-containing protein [Acidimicrobiia bacterium]|nr:NTP transferase domain-containing protein [Acidimicrobiia bacterium]
MSPTLVVMAAGLGSRFGGTKQLVEVGPRGEAFLDFAIRDAQAAGVGDIVVIVRTEIEADVERHLRRFNQDAPLTLVCQDRSGPAREKPWGTAHAILSAADAIEEPFIVVNADDYYGTAGYQLAVDSLAAHPDDAAVVAFRLANTLPQVGSVSRGVCRVVDGHLHELVETHGIERAADGTIRSEDPPGEHADDTMVSMNMWGFPLSVLEYIEAEWEPWLAAHRTEPKSEFLLPSVVDELRAAGRLDVRVLESPDQWVGVTNRDDLDPARAALADR